MKASKIIFICLALPLLFSLISCEKTIIEQVSSPNGNGTLYTIEGHAQKGPFIVGTDVTVAELNDKLFPTGRVFFSTILDDKGYFELPGVILESPYVQIKVRGRYSSEIWGGTTNDELTLYSLADIRKSETINVNIITHLESERVEYLVQEKNLSFDEAKTQAFEEFLTVFEWQTLNVGSSESLDLSQNNLGGAILLASATIFERVQDEYVDRLATITNFRIDFSDGKIDSALIQNRLLTAASLLNTDQILQNLEYKYGPIEFPDFVSLIDQFKENSTYTDYTSFNNVFPTTVGNTLNILTLPLNKELNSSESYSILINLPNSLPNAHIGFELQVTNTSAFSLPADPDVTFYPGNSSYGVYNFATTSKTWEQRSIPVNFNSGNGYGSINCQYSLIVDGFTLVHSGVYATWQ